MQSTLQLLAGVSAAALVFSKVLELTEQDHVFRASKATKTREARFTQLKLVRGEPLRELGLEFFLNKQALYIHFRRWIPLANVHAAPQAVVVLVHGLGEHIARYAHVALALNQAGFIVYGCDHQGHGRSEGDRLHLSGSFADYVDDVLDLVALAKRENPGKRVFIFGHSMGGLITIHALQRAQSEFAGAVISGPGLGVDSPPPAPVLSLLQGLSALVPKLPVDGLQLDTLVNNTLVMDLYFNDPLVHHGKIPAKLLGEIVNAMGEVRADRITLPYLLFHGVDDLICPMRLSEEFHSKTKSAKKQFEKVPGGHEALNEADGSTLKLAVNWLKEQQQQQQ